MTRRNMRRGAPGGGNGARATTSTEPVNENEAEKAFNEKLSDGKRKKKKLTYLERISDINIPEEIKSSVALALKKLEATDEQKEMEFPSSLNAEERKYIHITAQQMGFKSKSRGPKEARYPVVRKKEDFEKPPREKSWKKKALRYGGVEELLRQRTIRRAQRDMERENERLRQLEEERQKVLGFDESVKIDNDPVVVKTEAPEYAGEENLIQPPSHILDTIPSMPPPPVPPHLSFRGDRAQDRFNPSNSHFRDESRYRPYRHQYKENRSGYEPYSRGGTSYRNPTNYRENYPTSYQSNCNENYPTGYQSNCNENYPTGYRGRRQQNYRKPYVSNQRGRPRSDYPREVPNPPEGYGYTSAVRASEIPLDTSLYYGSPLHIKLEPPEDYAVHPSWKEMGSLPEESEEKYTPPEGGVPPVGTGGAPRSYRTHSEELYSMSYTTGYGYSSHQNDDDDDRNTVVSMCDNCPGEQHGGRCDDNARALSPTNSYYNRDRYSLRGQTQQSCM